MELKSIKVSKKSWSKLMKWRVDLGYKSLDELIEKILTEVDIKDLKGGNEK